jgi:glyoxylase-like metal-dependent hydrolase (beta-lactamase superfamily II)
MAAPLEQITAHDDGIWAVDTGYFRPQCDAAHLVVREGRAAFVDCGTTRSVPLLLAALDELALDPEDVELLLLTHVHLDHAGGAGALLAELPNATLVVHPRGAPHLIDPAKLEAGTRAVYGDAEYERLYGPLVPVPASRVRTVADGERIELGRSAFDVLHTPGHALHHLVYHDRDSDSVFTGDTFGISYRELDVRRRPFILPATTPTHFDPDQAHGSIERILSLKPRACFLTHYSRVTDLERLAEDLHGDLVAFVEIARRCAAAPHREREIARLMRAYLYARLDEHRFPDSPKRRAAALAMDIELNAQGLCAWLDRTAARA